MRILWVEKELEIIALKNNYSIEIFKKIFG